LLSGLHFLKKGSAPSGYVKGTKNRVMQVNESVNRMNVGDIWTLLLGVGFIMCSTL
jgi:hypothetical protein